MKYTLSGLSEDHLAEAVQIWHHGWHDGHADFVPKELTQLRTVQNFTERLKIERPNTRIALVDGAIAGFCILKGDELYQMYVAPLGRGRGIAAALMADAEARLAQAGHSLAWLDCAIGNDRAARFYEKSGWRNAGVRTAQLDTSEGKFQLETWRFEKALS